MSAVWVAVAGMVLPGVVLAPVWPLSGLGAGEDDIIYYWPQRLFLHDCVNAGYWPWLNPFTGMGRPILADTQASYLYPPTWLFIPLPVETAYPLVLWGHYSLAFWGMYRLLRARRLGACAAVFGGIAFAFCGFMLAHRVHYAMQASAAWLPWVFWRVSRYRAAGGAGRLLAAGAVIAAQCLSGHVQIAALAALGTFVWLLAEHGVGGARLVRWGAAWVCGAAIAGVQAVPTVAYLVECTRVHRSYWDFVENSWNPVSAVGWVLPMVLGTRVPNLYGDAYWGPSHQVEQFAYPGLLCLLLAALSLRVGWRADAARRGWVVLLGVALLAALGKYGPVCPLLYWIPGSNTFRVPARALLLCNLAAAALAALAIHDLAAALSPRRARLRAKLLDMARRPLAVGIGIVLGLTALLLVGLPLVAAEQRGAALASLLPWRPMVWAPAALLIASLALLRLVARRWESPRWLWALPALLAADLGLIGWTLDVPYDREARANVRSAAAAEPWLERVRESQGRIWVATGTHGVYHDSLAKGAANSNVLLGVRGLTDYSPLQPLAMHRFFAFTTWGVTDRAAALLQQTDWMRLCNVEWVLVCDSVLPSPVGGALELTTPQGWRLYRNELAAGFGVFVEPGVTGAIRTEEIAPYRWRMHVDTFDGGDAPGRAIRVSLAAAHVPGWVARVDGRVAAISSTPVGTMAVDVPAGRAVEIEWSYFPPGLWAGAALTGFSLAALGIAAVWERRAMRE